APLVDGEQLIRQCIGRFLPGLAPLPGRLHGRAVAISADRRPVAGAFAGARDLYVVAGMVSPIVFAPSLAGRLAASLAGEPTPDLAPFSPDRLLAGPDRSPVSSGRD